MADDKALQQLQKAMKSPGGAAEWNDYRTRVGPVNLSQSSFENAQLKGYNFSRCNMAAAKFFNADLSGADFTEAHLSYGDLRRANLANSFCSHCNFQVTQMQGANMVDANLEGADLRSAHCGGAYLVGANLAGANLTGTDLRGANMKFAVLKGAIVDGAKVEDADLSGVNLSEEQIKALHGFSHAIIRQKPAPEAAAKEKKARMVVDEDHEDLFRESDCYKILGIPPDSTLEAIEKAYRQKIKEYHPDRVNSLGEKLKIVAQREFQRIQQAYKSLTKHKTKPATAVSAASIQAARIEHKNPKEFTIEDYLKLIKLEPMNDAAYYNLGVKYFEKGLVELAIQSYKQAIRINPRNQEAAHNLKVAELARTLSE